MRGVGGSSTSEFGGAVPSVTCSWGGAFGISAGQSLSCCNLSPVQAARAGRVLVARPASMILSTSTPVPVPVPRTVPTW